MPLLDEVSAEARQIGAVNTVVFDTRERRTCPPAVTKQAFIGKPTKGLLRTLCWRIIFRENREDHFSRVMLRRSSRHEDIDRHGLPERGLDEKLEAIAAAGFEGVEIFENDLLSFNGTPADVRKLAERSGFRSSPSSRSAISRACRPSKRERVFARAERKFDVMQELGCDLLMVCSNVSPDSLGGIDRAAADLRELGERAASRGLRVAFEALAWGRHINDYRDAWEAVRRADHPAVGLVLDSFHILARKTDLEAIRAIPRDRIFLVQLADAPLLDMDYLSWSRHFRNFPGQGDLPVLDFMEALPATGYRRSPLAGDLQRPVPRRLARAASRSTAIAR